MITIFKFDSTRHHGNLEDAILESLFNGKYSSQIGFCSVLDKKKPFINISAAKFSGDNNEQHRRVTELKLAIVIYMKTINYIDILI